MVSRRWVLAGLLAGVAVPGCAEAPKNSPRPQGRPLPAAAPVRGSQAAALIAAAKLGGASSALVADARSGQVLDAVAGDLELPPASVAKAVTSLFALEKLGAGYRFATRLITTGPVVGGVVQGDLVLVGSGDPTLSSDDLGDMARSLAARGVKRVAGRYLAWAGALPAIAAIDADQPDHVGYNPGISGLNLNFNRVYFEWARRADGYAVTMDARGERFVPKIGVARMRVVARDLPLYTYAASGATEEWTVASTALGKGGSRWLPVRRPAVYAAEAFQVLARAQGIALPEAQVVAARPEGTTLAEHLSEPLAEIIRDMLRHSTNLTAEVLGLTASGAATLAASGRAMSDWAAARFGIAARFVDHSGLEAGSRISAAEMVRVLVGARASPSGAALRGLLKNVGMRDSAGRALKNSPVKVMAKTGTLNFVSGLAGYVTVPGGRDLVFAVFSADPARRDRIPKAEREQPPGGPQWAARARRLQGQLIADWVAVYG